MSMMYEYHLTTSCGVFRPVTTIRAAWVAYQKLHIFQLLSVPCPCLCGIERNMIDLVMVHGKPRHPQSQDSAERANHGIIHMLVTC